MTPSILCRGCLPRAVSIEHGCGEEGRAQQAHVAACEFALGTIAFGGLCKLLAQFLVAAVRGVVLAMQLGVGLFGQGGRTLAYGLQGLLGGGVVQVEAGLGLAC